MDFLGAVAGPVRWPLEVHRVESCPAGLPPGDLPPVSHALTPVATAGPALESGRLGSSSSHPLTFPSPDESTAPSATPWDPALEEGPSWPSEADPPGPRPLGEMCFLPTGSAASSGQFPGRGAAAAQAQALPSSELCLLWAGETEGGGGGRRGGCCLRCLRAGVGDRGKAAGAALPPLPQRPYDIHSSNAVESLVQLFSTMSVQYVPTWSKEMVALLRKVSHPPGANGQPGT